MFVSFLNFEGYSRRPEVMAYNSHKPIHRETCYLLHVRRLTKLVLNLFKTQICCCGLVIHPYKLLVAVSQTVA